MDRNCQTAKNHDGEKIRCDATASRFCERFDCFRIVCGYLDIEDITHLAMTNTAIYLILTSGFNYPKLAIFESRYSTIDLEQPIKPSLKSHLPSRHVIPVIDSLLSSRTPYSSSTGKFQPISSVQAMRTALRGTRRTFIGSQWLKCPLMLQRQWLTRLTGLQDLYIDIDMTGHKGIEPSNLATLLMNNCQTLKHLHVVWRPSRYLSFNMNSWWQHDPRPDVPPNSLAAFYATGGNDRNWNIPRGMIKYLTDRSLYNRVRVEAVAEGLNHRRERFLDSDRRPELLRYGSWNFAPEKKKERLINGTRLDSLNFIAKSIEDFLSNPIRQNGFRKAVRRKVPNFSLSVGGTKSPTRPGLRCRVRHHISFRRAIRSLLGHHMETSMSGEVVEVVKARSEEALCPKRYGSFDSQIESKRSPPLVVFPNVETVSLQLFPQHAAEFFSGCRFPYCSKFLVEEVSPYYRYEAADDLVQTRRRPKAETTSPSNSLSSFAQAERPEEKPEAEEKPSESSSELEGTEKHTGLTNSRPPNANHCSAEKKSKPMKSLSCGTSYRHSSSQRLSANGDHLIHWIPVFESMMSLAEAHLLLGGSEIFNHRTLEPFATTLRLLYRTIIGNNASSLRAISSHMPDWMSQELLLAFHQSTSPPALQNLTCVDCDVGTLNVSDFALNILFELPHIRWMCRYVQINAATSRRASRDQENKNRNDQTNNIQELNNRPQDAMDSAVLERWLLRILSPRIERLTLGYLSRELTETLNRSRTSRRQQLLTRLKPKPFELKTPAWNGIPEQGASLFSVKDSVKTFSSDEDGELLDYIFVKRQPAVTAEKVDALDANIPTFPNCVHLDIQPLEGLSTEDSAHRFSRIATMLSCVSFGSRVKQRGMEIKPRLRVSACAGTPGEVFGVLPKFELRVLGLGALKEVLSSPAACKQLRGLIGDLPLVAFALRTIRSKLFIWSRPKIKMVEVLLPSVMVRCLCTVGRLTKDPTLFRQITELRVHPQRLPSFLCTDDVFSVSSPEGHLLGELLRSKKFSRNRRREIEVRGLCNLSTFVYTRVRSRYRLLEWGTRS